MNNETKKYLTVRSARQQEDNLDMQINWIKWKRKIVFLFVSPNLFVTVCCLSVLEIAFNSEIFQSLFDILHIFFLFVCLSRLHCEPITGAKIVNDVHNIDTMIRKLLYHKYWKYYVSTTSQVSQVHVSWYLVRELWEIWNYRKMKGKLQLTRF